MEQVTQRLSTSETEEKYEQSTSLGEGEVYIHPDEIQQDLLQVQCIIHKILTIKFEALGRVSRGVSRGSASMGTVPPRSDQVYC